jgi:chromosome segregation ATPase
VTFNISNELKDIRKQKRKLEQMEGYMADSEGLVEQREKITELIDSCEVLTYQLEIGELSERGVDLKESIDYSVNKKEELVGAIRKNMTDKLKFTTDVRNKENGYMEVDEAISTLQKQVKAKEDQILHNTLKLKSIHKLINDNEIKIKHNKENRRELEKEVNKLEANVKEIDEKEQEMLKGNDKVEGALTKEYFNIKASIHEKTAQMQLELSKQARALDRANFVIMTNTSRKEELSRKINDIEYKLRTTTENQKSEFEELDNFKGELKELKMRCDEDLKKKEELMKDIEHEEKIALLLKGEILSLEEEKEVKREERRIREALEQLRKDEKGYHGFFYELIHPIQNKYQIAIKVALQGVLKLLVVDTIETAHKVDEYLSEKGLYLDTLILEKVPSDASYNNIHSKRKKLGGRGHMIADVVD